MSGPLHQQHWHTLDLGSLHQSNQASSRSKLASATVGTSGQALMNDPAGLHLPYAEDVCTDLPIYLLIYHKFMPTVGKSSSTMEHLGLLSREVEHQMVRGSLRQVNWPASLALHKHSSCETLLQGLVCKKRRDVLCHKTRHSFCRKKPWSQFNHVHPPES